MIRETTVRLGLHPGLEVAQMIQTLTKNWWLLGCVGSSTR
jgi:hypothetical protein